ncbi:class I SAM-dependent methyltransferase [Gammaproteobacteria bacterium]|nr:class I SAM-dependent methyltransferase [Gammaproteobacteria bacterium]
MNDKKEVLEFWNLKSCGEDLLLKTLDKFGYQEQINQRYELEPYIIDFADFLNSKDKKVLEIGVGLGADHQKFAESGAILTGIDLTDRAIEHAKRRFALFNLTSSLNTGDAEDLSFGDNTFDLVYSWGVIHHSPRTPEAIKEILRVLKPGGAAKIMIYHKWSMVGFMLWVRYALLRLKPFTGLSEIYSSYLESPGTKAYTIDEAHDLFSDFENVSIETVLTHGDLLTSRAGQRHEGTLLNIARLIWPRFIINKFFHKCGLFMLISAEKK